MISLTTHHPVKMLPFVTEILYLTSHFTKKRQFKFVNVIPIIHFWHNNTTKITRDITRAVHLLLLLKFTRVSTLEAGNGIHTRMTHKSNHGLFTIYSQILSIKNLRENLPVDAYILQNQNLHIMQWNTQSKPCLNVRRSRMRLTSILTG